jgi:hypothetical protein
LPPPRGRPSMPPWARCASHPSCAPGVNVTKHLTFVADGLAAISRSVCPWQVFSSSFKFASEQPSCRSQKFYDVNLLALLVSETLYYCKLALKTKLTFQIDHRLTYNVTNPAELAWDKHLTYFVLPHATKAKKQVL